MKRATEVIPNQLLAADTEPMSNGSESTIDHSILRKPIKTSVAGLIEARKAFDDGTDEVRKLLANECDIIYECKVCRNMFRSLANFISHKRIYCKSTFNSSIHFNFNNENGPARYSQDITTIVQAENDFIATAQSGGNGRGHEKDLSSIVERLAKRERINQMMTLSDFYEQVNNKLTQDQQLQKKHELKLDAVPMSSVAVYQTIEGSNHNDIKMEIGEINSIMIEEKNVLGPDGKLVEASELPKFPGDIETKVSCDICNKPFATEKMLKLHLETKHIPSTYVYQCPSCSQTFLQVKGVIRHLTNDHKKSMKRIRLMRDSLLKRRVRADEVQVKGPSRELARLQTSKDHAEAQNKAWLDNLENIDSTSVCTFCGKRFERRAVLISHSKVCQQKQKPNQNILLTRKAVDARESVTMANSNSNSNEANDWMANLDDSSNSNSLDAGEAMTRSRSRNKRKRGRAIKATLKEEPVDSNDEAGDGTVMDVDAELELSDSNSNLNSTECNSVEGDRPKEVKVEVKTEESNVSQGAIDEDEKKLKNYCKYCKKTFSNASNLRRHIQMLHLRQQFSCVLCPDVTEERRNDVINHVYRVHNVGDIDKKTIIAEYICMRDDESIAKPSSSSTTTTSAASVSTPSSNRRKEKHLEVLQDDEVQLFIDPVPIVESELTDAIDASTASLSLIDESNESSNIDGDENSNASRNNVDSKANESDEKPSESVRRKGRPRNSEKGSTTKVDRSTESTPSPSPSTTMTRRPVRNRTMPVKKDFVYDLSTLLKKEAALFKEFASVKEAIEATSPASTVSRSRNPSPTPSAASTASTTTLSNDRSKKRRRNTVQGASSVQSTPSIDQPKENETKNDEIDEKAEASNDLIVTKLKAVKNIRGAADVMAALAVNNNRAIFSRPPNLPSERPLTATIKEKTRRHLDATSLRNWPILKRPMSGSMKSKSNHARSLLRSRSLARKRNSFKQQLNVNKKSNVFKTNGDEIDQNDDKIVKISVKLADKLQLKCVEDEYNEMDKIKNGITKSIDSTDDAKKEEEETENATTATNTSKRRMTLLERLAENKTKKLKESVMGKGILKTESEIEENSD